MGKALKAILIGGIFLSYPFLSGYLADIGWSGLQLCLFAGLILWRGRTFEKPVWRYLSVLLALILFSGAYFAQAYLLWLIPAFVYLWLTALFGHTLWSPPSLCERLVRLQFPEFKPGIAEYLREVTWVWTVFFAINVPVCALLPLLAGQKIWALYTGFWVYLLMGLLGIGEWFYRQRRFPDLEIPPALETFKIMIKQGHKVFKGTES